MADYASNYTARLRVRYRQNGKNHSFTLRATHGALTPQATLIARANELIDAAAPVMWSDWSVLGAEFADRDSDIFLPVSGVELTALTSGIAPVNTASVPAYVGLVGRSAGGSKARLYLYGLRLDAFSGLSFSDYRLTTTESLAVNALVQELNAGIGIGKLAGIDGGIVSWYPYANLGFNAHWQGALRG